MTEYWTACLNLTKEKIARHIKGALKVMHVMFFSWNGLVLDHSVPIGTTVIVQYCCALLQDKVRPALNHEQPELLQHGVILLQESAATHCHHDVQNLV